MYFSKELLIQPLNSGTVIAELTTGSETKTLYAGRYEIISVGAGGGGSSTSNQGNYCNMGSGGSGAVYRGDIYVKQTGSYKLVAGSGGVGYAYGLPVGGSGEDGTPSGLYKLVGDEQITVFLIGGGGGASSGPGTKTAGAGGTITELSEYMKELTYTQKESGNSGTTLGTASISASISGGASKYGGYGAGGGAGSYGPSAGTGGNGYLKITYKGAY